MLLLFERLTSWFDDWDDMIVDDELRRDVKGGWGNIK
jgi:hypothetical protein